jgi:hypothetical protein
MTSSVDGRIVVDGWPASAATAARREYESIHMSYEPDGWLCGRITMEPFAKGLRPEAEVAQQKGSTGPRGDYRAPGEFDSFAFGLDPLGRLAWESNDISGDHVVAILSGLVSDDYLSFLRGRGVSYIIAGVRDLDLASALDRIGSDFGVRTLMLEGGGGINGSMIATGLVDEVSVLVAPVADGRVGSPSLFDIANRGDSAIELRLQSVERRTNDLLWLRYDVRRPNE